MKQDYTLKHIILKHSFKDRESILLKSIFMELENIK